MGAVGAAPDGVPWGAWVAVVVALALITTLGTVAVAIISRGARKHAADAAERTDAVLEQVRNSHSENLRDDMDAKYRATSGSIAELVAEVREQALSIAAVAGTVARLDASVGGIRDDMRQLRADDGRQRDEVAELRKEIPRLIADHAAGCAGPRD